MRDGWISLNGRWDFAIDFDGGIDDPDDVEWDASIVVPFAPETAASGIGNTDLYRSTWYRRTFDVPAGDAPRLLLHFGAVDYRATVWVDGHLVGTHQGGYTPFDFDITQAVGDRSSCQLVVKADDDPADLEKPRGKQDWLRDPHSIWYPRSSGIWQTVWLERVPATWIERIRWTPNLERWEIGCSIWCGGRHAAGLRLHVKLTAAGTLLADDVYSVTSGDTYRRIALSDPGIDDSRNELLWSPARPQLIEAELRLEGPGARLSTASAAIPPYVPSRSTATGSS